MFECRHPEFGFLRNVQVYSSYRTQVTQEILARYNCNEKLELEICSKWFPEIAILLLILRIDFHGDQLLRLRRPSPMADKDRCCLCLSSAALLYNGNLTNKFLTIALQWNIFQKVTVTYHIEAGSSVKEMLNVQQVWQNEVNIHLCHG